MFINWVKTFELVTLVGYIGQSKEFVLVQLSLTVTQKALALLYT